MILEHSVSIRDRRIPVLSGGVYEGAVEAHDRIRLKMSTGNVAEAEICLYGIK